MAHPTAEPVLFLHWNLIAYLVLLALGLLLGLRWLHRQPTGGRAALLVLLEAGLAIGLATVLAPRRFEGDVFAVMQLWAWGVFAAAPLVLASVSVVLLRAGRRWAYAPLALGAVLVLVAIDAFLIEPQWLDVTEVDLYSDKIDKPLVIAVLSDIQTDSPGAWETYVFERAASYSPDLVLLPGDYIQADDREALDAGWRALLPILDRSLPRAPLGAWAVPGNVEWPGVWDQYFEGHGVRAVSTTTTFDLGPVGLTGLTLEDSFDAHLQIGERPGFHIVLGHGPDFALGDVRADLLVAGHTHGGQVQIPFFGPIITYSQVPRAWASGTTRIDDWRTLVVSRGLGLERGTAPRLRFLCRPELVIIRLWPAPG